MFPSKVKFDARPYFYPLPDDPDEANKVICETSYSVDQTLSAEHNLRFGHIMNDLSTLLQAKDASQYVAQIMKLSELPTAAGFDANTPVAEIYRSIVPANCQTPSELQHFSRIYAKQIEPLVRERLSKNVQNVSPDKIDFTENKID